MEVDKFPKYGSLIFEPWQANKTDNIKSTPKIKNGLQVNFTSRKVLSFSGAEIFPSMVPPLLEISPAAGIAKRTQKKDGQTVFFNFSICAV